MSRLKFELVITVWEDGLFKLRDKIEADNTDNLEEQLQITMDNIKDKLTNINHPFEADDDIPF